MRCSVWVTIAESNESDSSSGTLARSPTMVARGFPRGKTEDLARAHPVAAKPHRVVVLLNLEHPSADVGAVALEKSLDVIAVNGGPAVVTEVRADRSQPPQAAEIDLTYMRTSSIRFRLVPRRDA